MNPAQSAAYRGFRPYLVSGITAILIAAPSFAQSGDGVDSTVKDGAQQALDSLDEVLVIDASASSGTPFQDGTALDEEERDLRMEGREIVHPVTSPSYADDAYITTRDLRGYYVNQQFPRNAAIAGGAARIYGVQYRHAVADNVQVLVSKLGFTDLDVGSIQEVGTDDLAVAVKYAFLQDWDNELHAAVGLGYEAGIGHREVWAGDDELRVFGAVNKGIGNLHLGLSANALFAMGDEDSLGDSDRLSAQLHADYYINETFSPLVELNYYKTLSEGDNVVAPFSGVDIGNLGGGESEDVLTAGLGGEARLRNDLAVRIAYESPLTDNNDLFGYRWTLSAVWRF
jgi:hypothetical protein